MKKTALLLLVLCLILCGCQSSLPRETLAGPGTSMPTGPSLTVDPEPSRVLSFYAPNGAYRSYDTGVPCGVQYITSPAQLPDRKEFQPYDEAFFQSKALVLVTELVNNGGVTVSIDTITYEDDTATVKLAYLQKPGDATTALAVWTVWQVVDAGLEYRWQIDGADSESDFSPF